MAKPFIRKTGFWADGINGLLLRKPYRTYTKAAASPELPQQNKPAPPAPTAPASVPPEQQHTASPASSVSEQVRLAAQASARAAYTPANFGGPGADLPNLARSLARISQQGQENLIRQLRNQEEVTAIRNAQELASAAMTSTASILAKATEFSGTDISPELRSGMSAITTSFQASVERILAEYLRRPASQEQASNSSDRDGEPDLAALTQMLNQHAEAILGQGTQAEDEPAEAAPIVKSKEQSQGAVARIREPVVGLAGSPNASLGKYVGPVMAEPHDGMTTLMGVDPSSVRVRPDGFPEKVWDLGEANYYLANRAIHFDPKLEEVGSTDLHGDLFTPERLKRYGLNFDSFEFGVLYSAVLGEGIEEAAAKYQVDGEYVQQVLRQAYRSLGVETPQAVGTAIRWFAAQEVEVLARNERLKYETQLLDLFKPGTDPADVRATPDRPEQDETLSSSGLEHPRHRGR